MKTNSLTSRQCAALATLALLAPAMRLIPLLTVKLSGRLAWLAPLIALPALLIANALIGAFIRARHENESTEDLIRRVLGRGPGNAVLGLTAVWGVLYAAFLLRSGADRFIATVYPEASPAVFICVTAFICLVAALGGLRPIGRAAEIMRPLMIVLLALILFTAAGNIHASALLPVTAEGAARASFAGLTVLDVTGSVLFLVAFLAGRRGTRDAWDTRRFARWSVIACLFLALLTAATLGCFGEELTAKSPQPFFLLTRNVTLVGELKRIEAPVTVMWVLPDFIITSLVLTLSAGIIKKFLPLVQTDQKLRFFDLSAGRWAVWACVLAAVAAALTLPRTARAMTFISERIVPAANLTLVFGLIIGVLLAGKIRKKI